MTTSELINELKITGSFPTSNDLFSNDDFLVLLNSRMKLEIMPLLITLCEEFFLLDKDFTISTPGASYKIPRRAIGAKLRDVQWISSAGSVTHLQRLYEEDRDFGRTGFYIKRNAIELSSDIIDGTLRMVYFARPNELVMPTECGQVQSFDTATKQIVLTSAPTTFAPTVKVDLIQGVNPYDLLDYDQALDSVSGTTLTFPNTLPDDLEVGDWVSLATESPVPMIPEELHPVLVQCALVAALSSKKDSSVDRELKILEDMKHSMLRVMDPRIENNSVNFRSGRLLNYFTARW